ncbi:MAG TPA: hypothetical protein VEL07_09625 [Planctomycetota bacterium]|nr:hypothetical protein [Planctomycetota bacterium]
MPAALKFVLAMLIAASAASVFAGEAEPAPAPMPEPAPAVPAGEAGVPSAGEPAGQPPPVEVQEWQQPRLRWFSHQREKLSAAIFELIEDIEVAEVELAGGSVDLSVGRKVYDNHDVLGSWTVVDHFRIAAKYPLYTPTHVVGSNITLGFTVGSRAGADFINIRQVMPEHYREVPSTEERLDQIENSKFYRLMLGEPGAPPDAPDAPERSPAEKADEDANAGADGGDPSETWIVFENEQGGDEAELIAYDGLSRARYSQLWNLIAFPFTIPLKSEWIGRMEVDEIISYTGTGTVELGPSVGWNFDVTGLSDTFSASVSFLTYLRGEWRISIWREDDRYAQVKVTRTARTGRSAGLNAETDELVDGFTLVNSEVNFKQTRITPFSFTVGRGLGRAFDVVYRYDMHSRDGQRAFERAVRGRFGLSDRLAGGLKWLKQPLDSPVRKLAIRRTDFENVDKQTATKFGFLYRHRHDANVVHADVLITTPDGVTRFFQSTAADSQLWKLAWGTREEKNHDFRITVDLDRWEQDLPDALTLSVIGEIIDTDTTGDEMRRYMDEVEEATGQAGFFPRPPTHLPQTEAPRFDHDAEHDRRAGAGQRRVEAEYGRSTFYYQVTYDQRQVERFVDLERTAMWPAMERAFGVEPGAWSSRWRRTQWRSLHAFERLLNLPLYIANINLRRGSILASADDAIRRWRMARGQKDVREQVRQLGLLFANRRYGAELSRLLHGVLAGERTSYQLSGTSEFGSFRDSGVSTIPIEPYPERLQRLIDFDQQRRRPVDDPYASIGDLDVSVPDRDHVALRFSIGGGAVPKALYFRLDRRRPWRLPAVVREAVYVNHKGVFQPGENKMLIDLREGFMADLFAGLTPGNRYDLRIATSRDGLHWGGVARSKFEVRPFPVEPQATPEAEATPEGAAVPAPDARPTGDEGEPPPPRLPVDPLRRDPGVGLELGTPGD